MDVENFLTSDFSGECLADILEAHKRGDVAKLSYKLNEYWNKSKVSGVPLRVPISLRYHKDEVEGFGGDELELNPTSRSGGEVDLKTFYEDFGIPVLYQPKCIDEVKNVIKSRGFDVNVEYEYDQYDKQNGEIVWVCLVLSLVPQQRYVERAKRKRDQFISERKHKQTKLCSIAKRIGSC